MILESRKRVREESGGSKAQARVCRWGVPIPTQYGLPSLSFLARGGQDTWDAAPALPPGPGVRADRRSLGSAWLFGVGPQATVGLTAGGCAAPLGGLSNPTWVTLVVIPTPGPPRTWPRPSCSHWGSQPLNTLKNACQLASSLTFSASPTVEAKKSNHLPQQTPTWLPYSVPVWQPLWAWESCHQPCLGQEGVPEAWGD